MIWIFKDSSLCVFKTYNVRRGVRQGDGDTVKHTATGPAALGAGLEGIVGSHARFFSPLRFLTVQAGRGDARLRCDAGDRPFPKSPLCRGLLLSLHVDAGGATAKTGVT